MTIRGIAGIDDSVQSSSPSLPSPLSKAATYYRWERELLALAETEPCSSVSAVRFAELPTPKQGSRNVAERCATLRIGSASLDIYSGCDSEQLKMLVELLCLC